MVQFYQTYKDNEIVSPLVTQISWSNNLLILSGAKSIEEKEIYIRMCIKENIKKKFQDHKLILVDEVVAFFFLYTNWVSCVKIFLPSSLEES